MALDIHGNIVSLKKEIKALHLYKLRKLTPEALTVNWQDFQQSHPWAGQVVVQLNEVPGHPGLSVTCLPGPKDPNHKIKPVTYVHTKDLR